MIFTDKSIHKSLLSMRSRIIDKFPKKYTLDEPPLRAELLSRDQMREHGRALADSHKVTKKRAPEKLLARLTENEGVLVETCSLLTSLANPRKRF